MCYASFALPTGMGCLPGFLHCHLSEDRVSRLPCTGRLKNLPVHLGLVCALKGGFCNEPRGAVDYFNIVGFTLKSVPQGLHQPSLFELIANSDLDRAKIELFWCLLILTNVRAFVLWIF